MKFRYVMLGLLMGLILFLRTPFSGTGQQAFHSAEEISFYKIHVLTPLDSGEYFSLPQNCAPCHGFDTAGIASVNINGEDINLYDDWETTMMALSGKDPLWRAKVSHEILVNPGNANELQDLCTSCHAPLGHYNAFYNGQPHYTLADLYADSLGQSGVSCHSCHGIKDSSTLGVLFTGQIPYDTNRVVYGPFPGPQAGPMQLYVGLLPAYGPHLGESKACSPCHTLISNTVDTSGTPTGSTFVEQATYHEYLNSDYPNQQFTCQTCHMPKIEDPVIIANGQIGLPTRTPFNLHTFNGANNFMIQLIRDHKQALGVDAKNNNFDSTLKVNEEFLKFQTLDLISSVDTIMNDTAFFRVKLLNKAGHKFPSGYPARRAVLQFVAVKGNGDTLFASGLFDADFEVQSLTAAYLPHYDMINSESEAQIYEMIMGDVNGNRTTVLERGSSHLKDNRIPPLGFTTTHPVYDTTEIAGDALYDPDFNKLNGVEGTGADVVHYHVPLHGYSGNLTVYASMHYQAVPPGWLSEMRNYSSAEIDTFLAMYAAANKTPMRIAADTISNIPVTTGLTAASALSGLRIGPNPTADGRVIIQQFPVSGRLEVYTASGQLVSTILQGSGSRRVLILPDEKGVYYLLFREGTQKAIHKIVHY